VEIADFIISSQNSNMETTLAERFPELWINNSVRFSIHIMFLCFKIVSIFLKPVKNCFIFFEKVKTIVLYFLKK
jgi:hypothetical protein